MSFAYDFPSYGSANASLQVSIDNSEKWDTLMIFKVNPQTQTELISNPQRIWDHSFDVTDFFRDGKSVRFKWNYNGYNDGYFALDNVQIWWDYLGSVENNKYLPSIEIQSIINNQFIISAPNLSIEKISIISIAGNNVKQIDGNHLSEQNFTTEEITAGIYLLTVDTNQGKATKKIVIR